MTVDNVDDDPKKDDQGGDKGDNGGDKGDQGDNGGTGDQPKTLDVDIYGEKVRLPYDVAKNLIAKRDERSSVFRDLKTQLEAHEKDLADARRRAEAAERAKEGNLAEAEALFAQKHQAQIDKYRTATVSAALKASLASNEAFIGGEAPTSDAMMLLLQTGQWDVDDDLQVTRKDGKKVSEAVDEFIQAREVFQKRKTTPPNLPRNQQRPAQARRGDLVSGMAEALRKRGVR